MLGIRLISKQIYHFDEVVAREVREFGSIAEKVVLMTPPRVDTTALIKTEWKTPSMQYEPYVRIMSLM